MSESEVLEVFEGGCHCGAVRFRVAVDRLAALDCNCSMCTMKGIVHVIVPRDRFTIVRGEDSLTTYRFNTGVAKHTFCRVCGVHPFYYPRSHPDGVDVNARCFDDPNALDRFEVEAFDGRNWEENVEKIR